MHSSTTIEFYNPGLLSDNDLQLVLVKTKAGGISSGYVPTYFFKMVLLSHDQEIGNIRLRVGNIPHLIMYGGHIGYGVEPAFRGQRYAARACKLLLPLARRHGLNTLWLTCNPDNIASRRTCELIGAELVEIVDVPANTFQEGEPRHKKCRYRLILNS